MTENKIFSSLGKNEERILENFDDLLQKIKPLSSKQFFQLPTMINELSHLLTDERHSRRNGYMNENAILSAYTHYFMWWNLYRLSHLFASFPKDAFDNLKDGDYCLDLGSGPLTVVCALYLARPELRNRRLNWYCLDISQNSLALGEEIFLSICAQLASTCFASTCLASTCANDKPNFAANAGDQNASSKTSNSEQNTSGRTGGGQTSSDQTGGDQTSSDQIDGRQTSSDQTDGRQTSSEQTASGRTGGDQTSSDRTDGLAWKIIRIKGELGEKINNKAKLVTCANMFNELYYDTSMPLEEAAKKYSKILIDLTEKEASLLVIEPAFPRSARFISLTRDALIRKGFSIISPCPHEKSCPMDGRRGGKWCHFVLDTEDKKLGAPKKLMRLSQKSALPKERASLSFVFASAFKAEADKITKTKAPLAARIASDEIKLPGNRFARYACCENGLSLISGVKGIDSGDLVFVDEKNFKMKNPQIDRKTGAIIYEKFGMTTKNKS
ncbi:MAG: small ribosomal subunit Rsm22 family protein [Treponemataceae bacterium]|nr:small ribosomal subunit Rsm22 family protein [Spirochaetales bacterium]MDY6031927.1 small ribosomal subunit Rsm22 family protein [Treponemataceae bacterium]